MIDSSAIYMDCNATTPLEPEVLELMTQVAKLEYGNAASNTHGFGLRAHAVVDHARGQIAELVDTEAEDIIFTSGATESDNLALLGLAEQGRQTGRKHIITSMIEHKAVLEPLHELSGRGFEVTHLAPNRAGWIEPEAVAGALRDDTLLISIMHVNNETGVIQPLDQIAEVLGNHPAYFHTDAAQGFGKELTLLRHPRVDLISVSSHKIYGPKGIGALVRRSGNDRKAPLTPLMYGGGHESGLRPGTLPVHLIAGFGLAAEMARRDHRGREQRCRELRQKLLESLGPFDPVVHGDPERSLGHVVNLCLPGFDSLDVIDHLRDLVAISNSSACNSESCEPSHVMLAMGYTGKDVFCTMRWSWCHLTPVPDMAAIVERLHNLRAHPPAVPARQRMRSN